MFHIPVLSLQEVMAIWDMQNINSFTYQSYQQKLFVSHYDYLIKDKLQGYYIKKENDEVIIKNFSKNIQIIDKGEEIVSNSNSNNLQEKVSIMIEIAIAKNWKLENIEPTGSDEFIFESNKQIAKHLEQKNKDDLEIIRAKSPSQQQKIKLQDEERNETVNLQELKEKLDANLVLEYAMKNFKLDAKNFNITADNKIDNLSNSQKPKNVIDFLQRELNLTTKEAIGVCQKIYENSDIYSKVIAKKQEKKIIKN